MIGNEEEDVTYPEFHLLADGGLLLYIARALPEEEIW